MFCFYDIIFITVGVRNGGSFFILSIQHQCTIVKSFCFYNRHNNKYNSNNHKHNSNITPTDPLTACPPPTDQLTECPPSTDNLRLVPLTQPPIKRSGGGSAASSSASASSKSKVYKEKNGSQKNFVMVLKITIKW